MNVSSVSIADLVTSHLKGEYGEVYRANSKGFVIMDVANEPYPHNVGKWFIDGTSIIIMINPIK